MIPDYLTITTLAKWQLPDNSIHFKVEVRNEETGQSHVFDYSGGYLAFRSLSPLPENATTQDRVKRKAQEAQREKAQKLANSRFQVEHDQGMKSIFELSAPTREGVFYALVADTRAGEETFYDFCSNSSSDEDSRTALAMWEACSRNARDFRRVAGKDFDKIETALQDY